MYMGIAATTRCLLVIVATCCVLQRNVSADPVAQDVLEAVVRIRAQIPEEARTAAFLGAHREGSGVVIDADGLVVTIGYLIMEATTVEVVGPDDKVVNATIVGHDYDTGFGLLRLDEPLKVTPMPLGESSDVREQEKVLVASANQPDTAHAAFVTSRREFAGYWEYLLEDAIFTAPPYPQFAGAALIGSKGQLLGIGSLFVNDALADERELPGNMFVPIDRLKPILGDLIAKGRPATPPRPWLGIFTQEVQGHLFVTAVAPEGPAAQAGLKSGDLIVGIGKKAVKGQADFYRAVWAQGAAGAEIPLKILQGMDIREVLVRSADRDQYFRVTPVSTKGRTV
jgi:S1-C subfamily serine protease